MSNFAKTRFANTLKSPKCNCLDCQEQVNERLNIGSSATHTSEQPMIEFPEMCENTKLIVNACKQVVQSADDYDNDVMTTPITIVQACEQLNCVIKKIQNNNES